MFFLRKLRCNRCVQLTLTFLYSRKLKKKCANVKQKPHFGEVFFLFYLKCHVCILIEMSCFAKSKSMYIYRSLKIYESIKYGGSSTRRLLGSPMKGDLQWKGVSNERDSPIVLQWFSQTPYRHVKDRFGGFGGYKT